MLAAVCAAPWALGVANPIQDVDPAQYADVARHVAAGGGWLDLRDSLGPFVNKPPLSIWAEAAAMKVLGATSTAARLPSVLFALLTLWATFALGRALLDPTRGAIAACLLAASVSMHLMVADPKVDLALTAMATLSLWAFVEARKRPGFLWLGWLFAALAVLSKGPLGLALVAVAVGPEAIRQRWGAPSPGSLWQRMTALKPVRGLLIVGALAAPYYWSVYRRDGAEGAGFVLWRQNFGRLFGQSGYHNDTTPLFFLHTALWAFAPFTPLLIAALVIKGRALWTTRRLPADETRVLVWGFLIPFAVFSISDYKLPQYIFCLAPLGALLSAHALAGFGEAAGRRARWGLAIQGGLAAGLVGWLAIDCFPAPGGVAWIAVAALAPIAGWWGSRTWPLPWQVTASAVASIAAFHLVYVMQVFPQVVGFQAGEALARRARLEDPRATVLPFVAVEPTFAVSYYAGIPAVPLGIEQLAPLVAGNQTRTAVVSAGAWPDFAAAGLHAEVIDRFPDYPTSRPHLSFLRAASRPSVLEWRELVRLTAQ